ncbi:MAG: hypothetical protein FWD71_09415 [Oscillospiraceae bacterium]|nr:hypothetical protein [Oscillospiraceae bacterium]
MAEKKVKPTIEETAKKNLEGELLKEFEKFLDYLKQEKISLPWKSIDGYNMKYKSKNVGRLCLAKNHIHIMVETVGWGKDSFDEYIDGQPDEIVDMFMERLTHKCTQCRPTCGCSRGPGKTIQVLGKQYENICNNTPEYGFNSDNMNEMTLYTPRASHTPEPVCQVPIETVKKLITAKKRYIEKILAE